MAETDNQTLEIIKTVCNVVTTVGVVFGAMGFYLQRRVWVSYHQRARADKAITLLSDLNKGMGQTTRAALKLTENLGNSALICLHDGLPFDIPVAEENLVVAALPDPINTLERSSDNSGYLRLTASQSFALRWQIVGYLNNIEFICQAWKCDVGDQAIIEAELSGLYEPANGQTFLRNYRDLFNGRTHYPALHDFLAKIDPSDARHHTIGGRPAKGGAFT